MFDATPTPWVEAAKLEPVQPEGLFDVLKIAGPMLAPAVARSKGRWDMGAVVDALIRGEMTLWVARLDGEIVAAACIQIVRWPRCKEMALPFVGGTHIRHWRHLHDELAEVARTQGCVRLTTYDTRGGKWLRVLRGWIMGHIELTKEL